MSILSFIGGLGSFGATRSMADRLPVFTASSNAAALLEQGSSYLVSGNLGGDFLQAMRGLSLTSPTAALGSRIGFGGFQTGGLARGLWAGAMPVFPMLGGAWPGLMGAGALLGGVGDDGGGGRAVSTGRPQGARRAHNPEKSASADAEKKTDSKSAAAKSDTATTTGKKSGASAAVPSTSAAEQGEKVWAKAAGSFQHALQRTKRLKAAFEVTTDVARRTITITPKAGAAVTEKEAQTVAKAALKTVGGKGPLGGGNSVLVLGGKTYTAFDTPNLLADMTTQLRDVAPTAVSPTTVVAPNAKSSSSAPSTKKVVGAPKQKTSDERRTLAMNNIVRMVSSHSKWKTQFKVIANPAARTLMLHGFMDQVNRADAIALIKFLHNQKDLKGVTVVLEGEIEVFELPFTLATAQALLQQIDAQTEWAKAAAICVNELKKLLPPREDGADGSAITFEYHAQSRTVTISSDTYPDDIEQVDVSELRKVLEAAIQRMHASPILADSVLVVGNKEYDPARAEDLDDMLAQFSEDARSAPAPATAD